MSDAAGWRLLLSNAIHRFAILWRLSPGAGDGLERLVYIVAMGALYTISIAGLLLWVFSGEFRDLRTRPTATLLILTCTAVTLLHMIVVAKARYRVPLHPVLAVWAAVAVAHVRRAYDGRRVRSDRESAAAPAATLP
jgi:hypothetical protein